MVSTPPYSGNDPAGPGAADERTMLERYLPLVRRVARDLNGARPPFLERTDVLQDGMIGLLKAIRSHGRDYTEGQFRAYAKTHIRGAIIDSYRAAGPVSRGDYEAARQILRDAEAGLAVAPGEVQRARVICRAARGQGISLDEGEGSEPLESPVPGPERRAEANQLLRRAVDALQALPVRDRNVFIACELAGEKQATLAQRLGITEGRISQIIGQVRRAVLLAIA